MKRLIFVCVLVCLLLSACGKQGPDRQMQEALDFRTALMETQGCSFRADVQIDFGEQVYEFALDCVYVPGQDAKLMVVEPEEISGIGATVSSDGSKVTFDGADISFGKLANGRIAPMSLPWLLGSAWTEGYVSSAGKDGAYTIVTYLMGYGQDEITVETWLNDETVPVRCDIIHNGRRYLAVTLENFCLQ